MSRLSLLSHLQKADMKISSTFFYKFLVLPKITNEDKMLFRLSVVRITCEEKNIGFYIFFFYKTENKYIHKLYFFQL